MYTMRRRTPEPETPEQRAAAERFLFHSQVATNYVRPVYWVGQCPRCGEDSPEMRDSPAQAQQGIDDCPCRDDPDR